jgi:hypothetical protein
MTSFRSIHAINNPLQVKVENGSADVVATLHVVVSTQVPVLGEQGVLSDYRIPEEKTTMIAFLQSLLCISNFHHYFYHRLFFFVGFGETSLSLSTT